MINRYYGWHTVYRFRTPNIGDRACAPEHYFQIPQHQSIDILQSDSHKFDKHCVIGGGGILHFTNRVEYIARSCRSNKKKVILWGIGHNIHKTNIKIDYPYFLREVDLVGLRDWDTPYTWVPCASCMSPLFDKEYPITQDYAFYSHYGIPNKHLKDDPKYNNLQTMDEVLDYLGSANYIITNSYHGAYWGILLRRKVIVYPFSTKFYKFRHKPVLIKDDSHWSKHLYKARIYDKALTDCRESNIKFYAKCKRFFSR